MKLGNRLTLTFAALLMSAATRPAMAAPRGWEIEGGVASQGVFDPGVHLFSRSSWLAGPEIRLRRDLPGDHAVRIAPEVSWSLVGIGRTLGPDAGAQLYLHRAQIGARATAPLLARGGLSGYARGGVDVLYATAITRDAFHSRTRDAVAGGAAVAAGLVLDAGSLTSASSRLLLSVEAGHAAAMPLAFGRWGHLDVNGANVSATVAVRF